MSFTRRSFLAAAALAPSIVRGARRTDIRIQDIHTEYEDFRYRTPLKFGGSVVDRVTLLNVTCVVADATGRSAKGFGSMPMGNVWSFPSTMGYDTTLRAMH